MESQIWNEINKKIVGSFLDILILLELREYSMCGYDVISHVHKKFNTLMSSGTVYSHLYSMERKGLIRGEGSERRRMYTLTERGKKRIKAILNMKDKILRLLVNVLVGE